MDLSKGINPDPQLLGIEIARAYSWNGAEIFKACLAALGESNYHEAGRALLKAWIETEGEL